MPVLTKINTNAIADDAVTGDKFSAASYIPNSVSQDISGTYSENRLYTSDAYTLSGNATVNSHLTLSSIKPTADVVLTAGGAYTLTGTGVLSGGSLLAKTPSLTGMTGELKSTVTQASGYTLGSGVSFPTGHVIQTVNNSYSGSNSSTMTGQTLTRANVGGEFVFTGQIHDVEANNWVFINMTFIAAYWRSATEVGGGWGIFREDTAIYGKSNTTHHFQMNTTSYVAVDLITHISFMDKSPATGINNYYLGNYASSGASVAVRSHSNHMGFNVTLQEIKV